MNEFVLLLKRPAATALVGSIKSIKDEFVVFRCLADAAASALPHLFGGISGGAAITAIFF